MAINQWGKNRKRQDKCVKKSLILVLHQNDWVYPGSLNAAKPSETLAIDGFLRGDEFAFLFFFYLFFCCAMFDVTKAPGKKRERYEAAWKPVTMLRWFIFYFSLPFKLNTDMNNVRALLEPRRIENDFRNNIRNLNACHNITWEKGCPPGCCWRHCWSELESINTRD